MLPLPQPSADKHRHAREPRPSHNWEQKQAAMSSQANDSKTGTQKPKRCGSSRSTYKQKRVKKLLTEQILSVVAEEYGGQEDQLSEQNDVTNCLKKAVQDTFAALERELRLKDQPSQLDEEVRLQVNLIDRLLQKSARKIIEHPEFQARLKLALERRERQLARERKFQAQLMSGNAPDPDARPKLQASSSRPSIAGGKRPIFRSSHHRAQSPKKDEPIN